MNPFSSQEGGNAPRPKTKRQVEEEPIEPRALVPVAVPEPLPEPETPKEA